MRGRDPRGRIGRCRPPPDPPSLATPARQETMPAEPPAEADKNPPPDPVLDRKISGGDSSTASGFFPTEPPTYDVVRDTANIDIGKRSPGNTYSGWRRYHAECHVCHGPNADGSSIAPALKDPFRRALPQPRPDNRKFTCGRNLQSVYIERARFRFGRPGAPTI